MTKNEAVLNLAVVHAFTIGEGGFGRGVIVDMCPGDERVVRVRYDNAPGPKVKTAFVKNLAPVA